VFSAANQRLGCEKLNNGPIAVAGLPGGDQPSSPMAAGKLARYQMDNKRLRANNRELASVVEEFENGHNPSTLRKFIGVAVKDGTAYGFTRLYVYAMQNGWAPTMIPADLILGVIGQSVTAMFDGPISAILGDMSDGIAEGSLGRMATFHALKKQEVGGVVCLVIPTPWPRGTASRTAKPSAAA